MDSPNDHMDFNHGTELVANRIEDYLKQRTIDGFYIEDSVKELSEKLSRNMHVLHSTEGVPL